MKRIEYPGAFLTAIVILLIVTSTPSVHAAPSATVRYVATTGSDTGNTCASSALPCLTIQNAVNSSVSGDTIQVAQGTYRYSGNDNDCSFLQTRVVVCVLNKALNIIGGFAPNWSNRDPSTYITTIDGQSTYRGVYANGSAVGLDMEGFTIQNCSAQGPTTPGGSDSAGYGGGMWIVQAFVTLRDIKFLNNQAVGQNTGGLGGAGVGSALTIHSSPTGTSSILQRVVFSGNQSFGAPGSTRGGSAFGAMVVLVSTVSVQDSIFTNNSAVGGNSTGSGIASDGSRADAYGAAVTLESGSINLARITATGNHATGGNAGSASGSQAGHAHGGAIFVEDSSAFNLSDSTISTNSATGGNAALGGYAFGGGISILNTPVTVDRTYVIANTAQGGNSSNGNWGGVGGGGIFICCRDMAGLPSATLVNMIVADNFAAAGNGINTGGGGGGIQIQGVTASLVHMTFARNRVGSTLDAGQALLALYSPGDGTFANVTINYSIIANHTQDNPNAYAVYVLCSGDAASRITFGTGMFWGNNANRNINSPCASRFFGTSTMATNLMPGFVSPGSPNYNYHLLSTSGAIDQASGSTTPIDIDGQRRPYNVISDYGADEYWPYIPPVPSTLFGPLITK